MDFDLDIAQLASTLGIGDLPQDVLSEENRELQQKLAHAQFKLTKANRIKEQEVYINFVGLP